MGAVFAIFAGFTFWFPVLTGLTLNSVLRKAHFFVMFLAVNITFFPQHFLGLAGMPRRYTDYPDSYTSWNQVSSYGRLIRIASVVMFIGMILDALSNKASMIRGRGCGTETPDADGPAHHRVAQSQLATTRTHSPYR